METSTTQALFAGTMVVGQAAQMASGAFDRTRTIQQMQYDLTGQKPSTLGVWLGTSNLHPLVKQARTEASSLRAKAAGLLNIAGMAGNVYFMLSGGNATGFSGNAKFLAKSMAVGMGTGMLSSAITSGDTALKGYSDLTVHFAHAGKGAMEDYVNLIGGLAKNANAAMVQKVAEQAFAKQLPPKAVLQMMAETDFMKPLPASAAKPSVTVGGKVFTSKSGHIAALAAQTANGMHAASRSA